MPFSSQICRIVVLLVAAVMVSACYPIVSPEASKEFNARSEPFSVSVYPVNVIKPPGTIHPSIPMAEKIVTFLETEELAKPLLVKERVKYDFVFSRNQQKIIANSAKAFASQVGKAGIGTDYALLVEIVMVKGVPGGVHYYLSDPEGELANYAFTNSKWDEFKEVQPKTAYDGLEVAIRMLRRVWKPQVPTE